MSPSTSAVYHCRFRSRLEARWAVFFDQLAIAWVYEPEGYVLSDGRRYLPDFHLPDCATWVEVKGHEAALDRQLMLTAARDLPVHSGRGEAGPLLMVLGPVPEPRPGRGDWGWMALDKGMADPVGPGGRVAARPAALRIRVLRHEPTPVVPGQRAVRVDARHRVDGAVVGRLRVRCA